MNESRRIRLKNLMRINHARKFAKEAGIDVGDRSPGDIEYIFRKWLHGTEPTASDLIRLDQYATDLNIQSQPHRDRQAAIKKAAKYAAKEITHTTRLIDEALAPERLSIDTALSSGAIGRVIREARLAKNLNQVQLGRLVDMTSVMISKYELASTHLQIIPIIRICDALGLSLNELVTRARAMILHDATQKLAAE